jgi:hypothetical protein
MEFKVPVKEGFAEPRSGESIEKPFVEVIC